MPAELEKPLLLWISLTIVLSSATCEARFLGWCFPNFRELVGFREKHRVRDLAPITGDTKQSELAPVAAAVGPYDPVIGTLDKKRSNEHQTTYFLAEGRLDKLYRVVPNSNTEPSYIIKDFLLPYKMEIEIEGYRLLNDLLANAPGSCFAVARAEAAGSDKLKLTDVKGRSLKKVLSDERIPWELRQRIAEDFHGKMARLAKLVRNTYAPPQLESLDEGWGTLRATVVRNGETVSINLHEDQVVVSFSPDHQSFTLTIVDPF